MNLIDKKVLIVEDDEDTQQLISFTLSGLLLASRITPTAEEAFEIIKNEPNYDLIILDLGLPKMGGIEFLELMRKGSSFEIPLKPMKIKGQDNTEVRRHFEKQIVIFNHKLRQIPVLILTGNRETNNVSAARELEAVGYIVKPFNPDFLKKRVTEILLKKDRKAG